MAKFAKEFIFNKRMRTIQVPQYTQDEFDLRFLKYKHGELSLQEAFPLLSSNALCFMLYGVSEYEMEHQNDINHTYNSLIYD